MENAQIKYSDISVNHHAVVRYKERTGSKKEDNSVRSKILKMFVNAYEVSLKPKYRATALLNHDFVEARYFRYFEWIIVVRGNEIITVHEGTADRWTRDIKMEKKLGRVADVEKDLNLKEESENKPDLYEKEVVSCGEWGKWPLFQAYFSDGSEDLIVVKTKKPRGKTWKYLRRDEPFLYVAVSSLRGISTDSKDISWKSGKILNVNDGNIYLV